MRSNEASMGGSYGNITLKGPGQQVVVEALRGRRAAVAPMVDGCTVVFDSACDEQDIPAVKELASGLSRMLQCSALAVVVHDDDVLIYLLYRNGELIDAYDSCPDYFDFGSAREPAPPAVGNVAELCTIFGGDLLSVETILRKRVAKGGYTFETDRHQDLVAALSLPAFGVGTALASLPRPVRPV